MSCLELLDDIVAVFDTKLTIDNIKKKDEENDGTYDYRKDAETWLSESQQIKLLKDGYCDVDAVDNVKQTTLLIHGYVRTLCSANGIFNPLTKEIIKILCRYFGSRWNTNIFIEMVPGAVGGLSTDRYITFRRNMTLASIYTADEISNLQTVEISQVPSDTLEYILLYLGHHKGIVPPPLPCPIRSIYMQQIVSDKWDADYIDPLAKKAIFEIILGANYMKITPLVHLGSAKIATLIKQMDQNEINRIIEEEEKYRREHDDNKENDDEDKENKNDDDNEILEYNKELVNTVSISDFDDNNEENNDNQDDNDTSTVPTKLIKNIPVEHDR